MWRIIIITLTGVGTCVAGLFYVAMSGQFTPPYWQVPVFFIVGGIFALWGGVSLAVLTFKSATSYVADEFKK